MAKEYPDTMKRNKKPDSVKLVRQLICYLFIKYDKQLPAAWPNDTKSNIQRDYIPEGYHNIRRYLGEILYFIGSDGEEADEDWRIVYRDGAFYRDLCSFRQEASLASWIRAYSIEQCIQPVEPAKGHCDRLCRTIRLTNSIMEDRGDIMWEDSPLEYFRFEYLPEEKARIRDDYAIENNIPPRTVQRDIHAVLTAIEFYISRLQI